MYCSHVHELFFSCVGLSFHIFEMYMYVSFLVLVCVVIHVHVVFKICVMESLIYFKILVCKYVPTADQGCRD